MFGGTTIYEAFIMPTKEKRVTEMADFQPQNHKKRFVLASDFDQTLSFNDSGFVLG